MNKLAPVCLPIVAACLAAPALAVADPSLNATPSHGEPGDEVTLKGRGWGGGSGCENRVRLLFKQSGIKLKLGAARHGDGSFSFDTHFQQAERGPAKFVAKQSCADGVRRAAAPVTIGRDEGTDSIRYRGQTEHGGRVRFTVVDGNVVTDFRFMNRCSTDRRRGSLVPGTMPIGDISFSRRGGRFKIFGRFRADGLVKGRARELAGDCDSGRMTWRAHRVG
jgi:hypothetical protein